MLFVLFFVIALSLRFIPDPYREQIARGIRETVLRPVVAMQRTTAEREERLGDPARLRAQRDSLAVVLIGHTTLATENRQLRELIGLRERLAPSFIPAEVIRVRDRSFEGAFLLTAGREDGVQTGAPIVAAAGLVGVVRQVDDRVAVGIDWTHPDFRASAMTVDGETYGIVEPRQGARGEAVLALTGAPFHTDLPEGTLIVSSGRGGVYPRGVPIGTVSGMEEADAGWRKSYLLRPLVSPAEMTHVLILGDRQDGVTAQDLAGSWGIRPPAEAAPDTIAPAAAAGIPSEPAGPAPAPPATSPPPGQQPRLLGTPVEPQPAPPDTTLLQR